MALISAMTPPPGVADSFEPPAFPEPMEVTITAVGDGRSARAVVIRRPIAVNVRVRTVHGQGIEGLWFEPTGRAARRGVVMLGGSEGGHLVRAPALVASHGFEVLSLDYFGGGVLPASLVGVPIETVSRGVDWLSRRGGVAPGGIFVEGESRGGELAILAALHLPLVRGVVAVVPTPIVFAGLRFGQGPVDASPWTFGGKPLPYITFDTWRRYQATHDASLIAPATLPLERLRVPLMIVAGQDDKLALSDATSRLAIEKARGGGAGVTFLSYPAAGHNIDAPFSPTTNLSSAATPYGVLEFGGTAEGYARADAQSWPQILGFLGR